MFFKVLPYRAPLPGGLTNQAVLLTDNWDDWFKYATTYILFYFDERAEKHRIGEVKIGQFGLTPEDRTPKLPNEFNALPDSCFSLGQDDTYYEKLNELGEELRDNILSGLYDVAYDEDLFERALDEQVMGVSLLRSVTRGTVRGQFRRLAKGGARLSRYAFTYCGPELKRTKAPSVELSFNVDPESNPPTNIHVLIGRNGVGKTHHLQLMTRALVEENGDERELGGFRNDDKIEARRNVTPEPIFENIVSVTFSAFDPFEPLPVRQNKSEGVRYSYVGLKKTTANAEGGPRTPKTPGDLGRDFGASVRVILGQAPKIVRWRRALSLLEADPIFREANVAELAYETGLDEPDGTDEETRTLAGKVFSKLSSGHKIVLLTITRLVESVEEKTLVLLDEPEAHLHPPLLSAFVRALSDLLTNRNGVAIIATHSPVVLQEVPSSCVWKIRRSGREISADRPEIQTFGENVGILTREVFRLEVTDTGFHQLLNEAVQNQQDYNDVLEAFGGQLGAEARAIVQGLLASQDSGETE